MSRLSVVYPPSPKDVKAEILNPSPDFRAEVWKTFGAMALFVVVYFLLLALAVGLAALCVAGGIGVIILKPMFLTIMLGLGLVGLGAMVVFFLFKFLFKKSKTDRSGMVEVKESQEPELFAFIKNLTHETGTPFPKKVYLTPEVNAFVFYDSTFWSMFFPVKKNLAIGLGLVNCVNLSEFKAILAHEFGHFSQRSMKIGVYVYNLNRIIYNLLYDNEGYGKTLESWANISGYFAFFASITVRIVQGIQWVLEKMYGVVNLQYMSLSRQMEFHADAVAASVTGGMHLVDALRRLEVADLTYNKLFDFYGRRFRQGWKPENAYPQHAFLMKAYAADHGLTLKGDLPMVYGDSFARFNTSRVIIKDQWASHPSTDDREKHLRSLNLDTPSVEVPAWILFADPEALQKNMTEKVYSDVQFESTPEIVSAPLFQEHFGAEKGKHDYHAMYKGFYDWYDIKSADLNLLENRIPQVPGSLSEILTSQVLSLPLKLNGLQTDIETLTAIRNGQVPVKRFEFEGKKYRAKEADAVRVLLDKELNETEAQLSAVNDTLIAYFLRRAEDQGLRDELLGKYRELFDASKHAEEDQQKYATILTTISPIYQGTLQLDQINGIMHSVKLHEVLIKERINALLLDLSVFNGISKEERVRLDEYLGADHRYFFVESFNEKALELFNEAMAMYYVLFTESVVVRKKVILDFQAKLEDRNEVSADLRQ